MSYVKHFWSLYLGIIYRYSISARKYSDIERKETWGGKNRKHIRRVSLVIAFVQKGKVVLPQRWMPPDAMRLNSKLRITILYIYCQDLFFSVYSKCNSNIWHDVCAPNLVICWKSFWATLKGLMLAIRMTVKYDVTEAKFCLIHFGGLPFPRLMMI